MAGFRGGLPSRREQAASAAPVSYTLVSGAIVATGAGSGIRKHS